LQRLVDPARLAELLNANARDEWKPGIDDAARWLADPAHFALEDGNDLGMFEATGDWPGPLKAHVFFASRGKRALETARAMLTIAFGYGATEILGETPTRYPEALMFARMLGFRPYGEDRGESGTYVLSRLAKAQLTSARKPVITS
jgi:hypothetical protein